MSKTELKLVRALEKSVVDLVAQGKLSARHTAATLLRVSVAALGGGGDAPGGSAGDTTPEADGCDCVF
jgi:hypothetical protein